MTKLPNRYQTHWEDGSPRSINNAFDHPYNAQSPIVQPKPKKASPTNVVKPKGGFKATNGTIPGMGPDFGPRPAHQPRPSGLTIKRRA